MSKFRKGQAKPENAYKFPKGHKINVGRKASKKTKAKMNEAHKGNKYCLGNKLSGKHKENISKAMKGKHPKNEIKKGHKWSKETIKKRAKNISKALKAKGIKPPSRRGIRPWNYEGKTPLNESIRKSFEYRQWRSDIFTRDDFTCQKCGLRGNRLEAHHKKKFSKIIGEYQIKSVEEALQCEELWNINNGITFCKKCHRLKGKHNKD